MNEKRDRSETLSEGHVRTLVASRLIPNIIIIFIIAILPSRIGPETLVFFYIVFKFVKNSLIS